jgi:hypothetical protein
MELPGRGAVRVVEWNGGRGNGMACCIVMCTEDAEAPGNRGSSSALSTGTVNLNRQDFGLDIKPITSPHTD